MFWAEIGDGGTGRGVVSGPAVQKVGCLYIKVVDPSAPWFILSTKHALVQPREVIAPYEQRLKPKRKNQEWSNHDSSRGSYHVVTRLKAVVDVSAVDRIVILAGKDDCDPLYWRCAGQTARKFERPLALA